MKPLGMSTHYCYCLLLSCAIAQGRGSTYYALITAWDPIGTLDTTRDAVGTLGILWPLHGNRILNTVIRTRIATCNGSSTCCVPHMLRDVPSLA